MTDYTYNDNLKQKPRVGVFMVNTLLAVLMHFVITGNFSPFGSDQGLWLLAALAYWLFSLITVPFFTPPKDALANSTSTILLLAPITLYRSATYYTSISTLYWITVALALISVVLSLVAIFKRSRKNDSSVGSLAYKLSNVLGKGEILFTFIVIISVLGFYEDNINVALLIMGFWLIMVIVKPIELLIKLYILLSKKKVKADADLIGILLRVDHPNIVKVEITDAKSTWRPESRYFSYLPNGEKAYILPLFIQIQNEKMIGTGLIYGTETGEAVDFIEGSVYKHPSDQTKLLVALAGWPEITSLGGVLMENSTIQTIKFRAVQGQEFEEGMVIFCRVRNQNVYYQILDATTYEETFQSSPDGMHIVAATQLGTFDEQLGFQKFPWLPEMNQPVFLVSKSDKLKQQLHEGEFYIGKIPSTEFEVPVNLNELLEYHTAILGITGTGKTELALSIIRNALVEGIKVFCVDFTGEYRPRLKDTNPQVIGLSEDNIKALEESLHAVTVGTYGAKEERAALKNFLDKIQPAIDTEIDTFLMSEEDHLGVLEITEITNTRATLRTTEMYLSSIMNWARKHRRARRVLIVLEEAHTIIPEVHNAGFDSDTQWIVGRIGQIALQGRKYGVGLLILSQRTALVSKTILSQCNTYFAHCLVDKTSLDYLSGVYSSDHVKAIPNLRTREFLATGKAVKSEQPLLVRIDFDQNKLDASQSLNTDFEKVKERRRSISEEKSEKKSSSTDDDFDYLHF